MKLTMILSKQEKNGEIYEIAHTLTDREMYQRRNSIDEILLETFDQLNDQMKGHIAETKKTS